MFPPDREKRWESGSGSEKACPFCPGLEASNQEVLRVSHSFNIEDAGSGKLWLVRVITNKFPLTDYHEVVIHSPDHYKDIGELQTEQVLAILNVFRERYNFHTARSHGSVMIFLNHNIHAGASLHHPHSQIVVVPPEVELHTEEREPVSNVVLESRYLTVFCPEYSEWEYELWLAPKDLEAKTFGEASDEELKDLAYYLKRVLFCLDFKMPFSKVGDGVSYNFYIYHGRSWFLRIVPRIDHEGGFEIGTNILVNEVDPKRAANEYRKALEVEQDFKQPEALNEHLSDEIKSSILPSGLAGGV